jgi:2-phosphoglycerate kinase
VPAAVLEFYNWLSDDTIHWFLKVHHENMRALIGARINAAREAGEAFILEGAALRPEYLGGWQIGEALTVCLHVEPHTLRERIRASSNYLQQGDQLKVAIDKFTERSVRENEALAEAAVRHKIQVADVTDVKEADRLAGELTSRLIGPS